MSIQANADLLSPRAHLQDALDGHSLHRGRLATIALLREVAGVERVADVPDDRIAAVREAVKRDRLAAHAAKHAARFGN